jgi:hypothetical protein
VRTEKHRQAIDSWCAWRALHQPQYMKFRKLRINQTFLELNTRDEADYFNLIIALLVPEREFAV